MKLYGKLENHKLIVENQVIAKEKGLPLVDVEMAWDGSFWEIGYVPEKPAPTKAEIRILRQTRYVSEADPIRYDYDEALARGEETAEELKQEWLAKKDEIRADLPYPVEND